MTALPSRTGTGAARRAQPPAGGSASVEFCIVVPFFLLLLAATWDLGEYISHRTDLVRESYVAAEALSNEIAATAPPFANVLGPAGPLGSRLRHAEVSVAGAASAAVIARGTVHRDGTACTPGAWCPPVVLRAWPATEADRVWRVGTAAGCAAANALPAAGATFGPTEPVLPGENAGGAPEDTWFSRNMDDQEWWVVMDVCIQPRPGVFTRFGTQTLDLSFDISRRVAWPSVHERVDCAWC